MFLDETGTTGLPSATATATGMWGRDAVGFVDWLNNQAGDLPLVRLPTSSELSELPTAQAAGPVWVAANAEPVPSMLWVPPGMAHPHRVEVATLRSQLERDLVRVPSLPLVLIGVRLLVGLRLTLISDTERELDYDLARSLASDFDFDYAGSPDQARESRESRKSRKSIATFTVALDRDVQLGRSRDPAWDRVLAREFDRALAVVCDIDRDAVHALALNCYFAPGRTEELSSQFTDAVGVALAQTVHAIRGTGAGGRNQSYTAAFRRAFIEHVLAAQSPHDVHIDLLPETLTGAKDELAGLGLGAWGTLVADRLLDNAYAIFNRARPVSTDTAAAIRLAALCLAVETEQVHSAPALGMRFREIAAGITLLERRATGQQPADETILLARA